jgi:hypothetical protein
MWPTCINQLIPLPFELRGGVPKFLKIAFNKAGIENEDEMFIPLRPLKILGNCSTALYLDCPNIPDTHVDRAHDYEGNPENYDGGRYYWFDFDVVDFDMTIMIELRMVFNQGIGDANDGLWGAVWERSTEFQVADILSGTDTAIIAARSMNLIDEDKLQDVVIPSNFDANNGYDPLPCSHIKFFNNLKLEEIIGVAIRWCFVFTSNWNYERQGYDL